MVHDSRTQMAYTPELTGFESEQFEYGGFGETEWSGETAGESVLTEVDEAQLASGLLEVTSEAELDRFLGDFIMKFGHADGQVIRSPLGQAISGVLKGVAKKALPLAGGAIGAYFGGPLGAKIGSGLASAAGTRLGLQAAEQDREFEGARQFIRVAADTVRKATAAPASADPRAVAQAAAVAAAKKVAPPLLGPAAGPIASILFGRSTGRWLRRGNEIVLFGV
jgi:hypothetical protein